MALHDLAIVPGEALDFEDLIAPVPIGQFIAEYWQKKPCHISGSPDKYRRLFSWNALNNLLASHHFAHPRFRMSKGGAEIPPQEYLETLRFTKGNRVDEAGLYRQFSQGATIIVQHADEFSSDLFRLAEALEAGLGWHTEVEIIAGSGCSNGLPIHVDANDCLVFQIEGSKRWRFYGPTRPAPLKSSKIFPHRYDTMPVPQPDPNNPILTVEVNAGDFVYIPRGWWHLVEPLPGPCLSLNPTIYSPAVQDLLRWLVDELSVEDACRAHIPVDADAQEAVLEQVRMSIADRLNPQCIDAYRRFLANEMEMHRSIDLPAGALRKQALDGNATIMVAGQKPLHVTVDNNSSVFRLRWKGSDKHFSSEHLPMLLALNDGRPHRVSDVLAVGSSPQGRLLGIGFLLELWEKDIIVCC